MQFICPIVAKMVELVCAAIVLHSIDTAQNASTKTELRQRLDSLKAPMTQALFGAPHAAKTNVAAVKIGVASRLHEIVRACRKQLGLTQPELHRRTGIQQENTSRFEARRYGPPVREVELLLDALELAMLPPSRSATALCSARKE